MVRKEIVEAVLKGESGEKKKQKKSVVITSIDSVKADFEKISKSLNLTPDSKKYHILKSFCEGKRASFGDTKTFIHRIKPLSEEQLTILERLCNRDDLTITYILDAVQFIKKFGKDRLLILRSFVDLGRFAPGQLNQFFSINIPKGSPKEIGKDAYRKEVSEKSIRPDQVNVFYNICQRIPGITPMTAIAILPKIRSLEAQHAQIINTFLVENVCFGSKPIDDSNIQSFLNLWLSLPVLNEKKTFEKLIARLSRESDEKKKDFQVLIHLYKEETEKPESGGKLASGIRSLFG